MNTQLATVEAVDVTGLRLGTPDDEELFETLWMELLNIQMEFGGLVAVNEKDLAFIKRFFHAYLSKTYEGIVLFGADDNALLLWGETGIDLPWSHDLGMWIMAWGIYVRPEYQRQGWGKRMRLYAKEYFKNRGFDSSLHGVWPENKAGRETLIRLGAEIYQETYLLRY